MHICFVAIDFHQPDQGGGIASYTRALGQELVRRHHRVTIIAKGKRCEWRTVDGLRVLIWPFGNLSWYMYRMRLFNNWLMLPVRELEWSWSIKQAIQVVRQEAEIDVIESCESGNQFLDHPVIRTHGAPHLFSKFTGEKMTLGLKLSHYLELRSLRAARLVTSPSRFQAAQLGAELGWSSGQIRGIPNPVAAWALEESRCPPRSPDSTAPLILYTGRIQSVKGSLVLLQSVSPVARAFPDVQYVLAGARHMSISESVLNQVLAEDGRADHVKLLGHVPWQELTDWYRRATVFVMPSYYESFCISCVEAMAFGIPVVATTAGGLPEVVEDGVTGCLVPPGDSEALAHAIIRLLRDPDLRRRMGEAGRACVRAKFSAEHIADQTLAAYAECLQRLPSEV